MGMLQTRVMLNAVDRSNLNHQKSTSAMRFPGCHCYSLGRPYRVKRKLSRIPNVHVADGTVRLSLDSKLIDHFTCEHALGRYCTVNFRLDVRTVQHSWLVDSIKHALCSPPDAADEAEAGAISRASA